MSARTPVVPPQSRRRGKAAARSVQKKGLPPGSAVYVGDPREWEVRVKVFEYGPERCDERNGIPEDLQAAKDPGFVSWLDVIGIHDVGIVTTIAKELDVHHLAVEDILNPSTRPKYEAHEGVRFVVARMLRPAVEGEVTLDPTGLVPRYISEQLAVLVGNGWVVSFQEEPGDVFESVRVRIRTAGGRIRTMGPDYLLHALLDAVCDAYFEVLLGLEDASDKLMERAVDIPSDELVAQAQRLRTDLSRVRRAASSLREAVGRLVADTDGLVSDKAAPYFRDLQDHLAQTLDLADVARDRTQSAIELSLAVASNRMNEVMRVLTVVASIFIPLTFLAGIYGMNFAHMPELAWRWAYPTLLALMVTVAAGMVAYFRRQGWL